MTLYIDTRQIAARFSNHDVPVSTRTIKTWIKTMFFPAEQPSKNSGYVAREELIAVWEKLYYAHIAGHITRKQLEQRIKTASRELIVSEIKQTEKKGGKK